MRSIAIIPAYNEAAAIVDVARSVIDKGIDVIVINDGSSDDTEKCCRRNKIPVISLKNNLGIGGAVQCGYRYAYENGYDIAFQFDGDGQHDINSFDVLIQPILDRQADFVIGSRFLGEVTFRSTWLRRVGIKWISFMLRFITGKRITDPTSGYRAANAKVIEFFAKNYPVDYPEPESTMWLIKKGFHVNEVSVSMFAREHGSSSINSLKSVYYMIKVSLALLITRM